MVTDIDLKVIYIYFFQKLEMILQLLKCYFFLSKEHYILNSLLKVKYNLTTIPKMKVYFIKKALI